MGFASISGIPNTATMTTIPRMNGVYARKFIHSLYNLRAAKATKTLLLPQTAGEGADTFIRPEDMREDFFAVAEVALEKRRAAIR